MKIYYYIYQITNLVNNKIYVGVHKTSDLNDDYMGSGKVIKDAIKKYGIDNFKKDILEYFEDSESMYAREKEIVTDEFLLREDTYNLRRGGTGGFDYLNKTGMNVKRGKNNIFYGNSESSRKGQDKLRYLRKHCPEFEQLRAESISNSLKIYYINGGIGSFTGKSHTQETKEKMRLAQLGKQDGENNSQYGTCWIYHELIGNKKIKKELLPEYIEQGWYKGRKNSNK